MRKKIISVIMMTLFILTSLPIFVSAGIEDLTDPQITDEEGDAFGYIDIDSVWFYENEETPDFLYVSMKINEPSELIFQQTFATFWYYKDIRYSVSLHLAFSVKEWYKFRVGEEKESDRREEHTKINGSYDLDTGIITWFVPKDDIGSPTAGDLLTNTWSNAFRRVGFIGRIGFTRHVIDAIIVQVLGNNMWDYAPERGEYGLDYEIQY